MSRDILYSINTIYPRIRSYFEVSDSATSHTYKYLLFAAVLQLGESESHLHPKISPFKFFRSERHYLIQDGYQNAEENLPGMTEGLSFTLLEEKHRIWCII